MSKLLSDTSVGLGAGGPRVQLSTGGSYVAPGSMVGSIAGGLAQGANAYNIGQQGNTQGAIDNSRNLQNQKVLAALMAANKPGSRSPVGRSGLYDNPFDPNAGM